MKGMGMQHPGFSSRTPKGKVTQGVKRSKKTTMDKSHMNYTKDKKSGSPFGK